MPEKVTQKMRHYPDDPGRCAVYVNYKKFAPKKPEDIINVKTDDGSTVPVNARLYKRLTTIGKKDREYIRIFKSDVGIRIIQKYQYGAVSSAEMFNINAALDSWYSECAACENMKCRYKKDR